MKGIYYRNDNDENTFCVDGKIHVSHKWVTQAQGKSLIRRYTILGECDQSCSSRRTILGEEQFAHVPVNVRPILEAYLAGDHSTYIDSDEDSGW